MQNYDWGPKSRFVNRRRDLAELEAWWEHPTRDAIAPIGRRRVGKSWLFRSFADGKPAVILVADKRLLSTQMVRFAKELQPELGVQPAIPTVAELIRILYELGREEKILAVVDEFPFLIPDGKAGDETLSEIQAIMEVHRDTSQTKLVLCGSLIAQMESLFRIDSPLHGRLRRLDIWPLTFAESRAMTSTDDTPVERITRFAVGGGMARYIGELGHGALEDVVCQHVLDRRGSLFDDPRAVLEQELRSPATYFSILEVLADAPAGTERLTTALQMKSTSLSFYLDTLISMRLISRALPVGAASGAKSSKYRISDGFIRFWFRFVFGNQQALQDGLAPAALWAADIEPYLSDFVAPTFEELCARYTRIKYGGVAPDVGAWWGPALNPLRAARQRLTEEVDVVGAQRRNLKIVGECKWTTAPMSRQVLDDLHTYKIPAIQQEKRLKLTSTGPTILLFSKSGFERGLIQAAETDATVRLIGLDEIIAGLDQEQ